jgi:sugar lactone lactonase YvrE
VLAGTWNRPGHRDGIGKDAQLAYPTAMVAGDDGELWVSEWTKGRLRRITIATGEVRTVATKMKNPIGLARHDGKLLAFDVDAGAIWRVDPARGTLSTLAPRVGFSLDGNWGALPTGMLVDQGWLYFTASGQHLVRRARLSDGHVETVAGGEP